MSTSTTYEVMNIATTGLLIPLIISVISVVWLIGIAVKAMKSKDLI